MKNEGYRTPIKRRLKRPFSLFSMFFFDPRSTVKVWRGLPFFAMNAWRYRKLSSREEFELLSGELFFRSFDRFSAAADVPSQYFHQDLWAARSLYRRGIRSHTDVGSRIDGFIAHILPFCKVEYVDIRPLDLPVEGFHFRQGSINELPYATGSVESLSCLHVLEHIGLGRYGDPVDPEGYRKAASELVRVLKPGGTLLLGTPVGRERLCFDAHRVFDPQTIVDAFAGLELDEFALIDDKNLMVEGATFEDARRCEYGCGLFALTKP